MIRIESPLRSNSIRIIDMTNAGKRGKKCKVFDFCGTLHYEGGIPETIEERITYEIKQFVTSEEFPKTFDESVSAIMSKIKESGTSFPFYVKSFEIKGVDAPKEKLIAGLSGVWSGYVNENGISLSDQTDQNNLPCEITHHTQSDNTAYRLASKVWREVQQAKTMREASNILEKAGCKLHSFCAMD